MRKTLALLALVGFGLTACGDDNSDVASINTTPPSCSQLFAQGSTLPEDMPEICIQHDSMHVASHFNCVDGRKLYQLRTEDGDAWAFSEGPVSVVDDTATDFGYATAYRACHNQD